MVSPGRDEAARDRIGSRAPSFAALALPCLAGLAYLAGFGAPSTYLATNAGALALGLLAIAIGWRLDDLRARRVLSLVLLVVLAAPLLTGPQLNGIARWIPLGAFQLHSGALAIPLLACLAARDRDLAPPLLLAAVFLTLLQPDAASAFALTGAAIGLYFAWWDWKPGLVAVIAFLAALIAGVEGRLPPQPFVEEVLSGLVIEGPLIGLALLLSLIASLLLILRCVDHDPPSRFALAGVFGGFCITGLMAGYPNILIGYGAAPIIGFALALALKR